MTGRGRSGTGARARSERSGPGASGAARLTTALVVAVPLLLACEGGAPPPATVAPQSTGSPAVRTTGIVAGAPTADPVVENPYADDPQAMAEGRRYYAWMNCHGCHGMEGGGGMGPPFADADWIYGSEPENIHQSIVQGRPNGMPAFGGKIPDDRIWMIAAYVRSLGPPDERTAAPGGPTQQQGGGNTGSPAEAGGTG